MKIQNTTQWNTTDLRRLILAGMKQFLQSDDWRYKQMLVIIRKKRLGSIGGRAFLSGSLMKLYLPNEFEPIRLAWVIGHELNHIVGLKHTEMKGSFFANHQSSEELLASDLMQWALPYLNIGKREVVIKEKKDIQITRYEKTKKVLKDKITKLKRLQKQIQKYSNRVRYYERALTAAGKMDNLKKE